MGKFAFSTLFIIISAFTTFTFATGGELGASKGANGTAAHPWLIEDFQDFNSFCNDPNRWDSNDYTRLDTDLDLDPALNGRQTYGMAPIAGDPDDDAYFDGKAFAGKFNGNDHAISNLSVNGLFYCGLFGRTSTNSSINKLTLHNASIISTEQHCGLLVGGNSGSISYCTVNGFSSGIYFVGGLVGQDYQGNISHCNSSGTISGADNLGGIVGYCRDSRLDNCYSSNTINGKDDVGGLVGICSSSTIINNCFSTGSVQGIKQIGGLVGTNYYGTIQNCFSSSSVKYFNEGGAIILTGGGGGLVGLNEYGNIDNCFSSGPVDFIGYGIGGLVGRNKNGNISNSYSISMMFDGGDYAGGLIGFNEEGIIKNCYFAGLTRYFKPGGLIGKNGSGNVINCYWDTQISNCDTSNGGTGLTTAQMQDSTTFLNASWDFIGETTNGTEDIWHMPYNLTGYPVLWWQRDIPGDTIGKYGVDMEDFSELSNNWQTEYQIAELSILAQYWLEGK